MNNHQPKPNPQRGPNPYVGPQPFKQGQKLYGRTRETLELYDLLIAERIVMLHSPSGAGKTSLLQAALQPRLERKRFRVLPTVRVHLEPGLEANGANRYVMSTLLHLEDAVAKEARRPDAELAQLSLHDYLVEREIILPPLPATDDGADEDEPDDTTFAVPTRPRKPQRRTILIFDQFEEVLTVDATDRAAKAEFFVQLGEVLAHRHIWAIFSLREDYVAQFDPYLRPLPTRLQTRFRLDYWRPIMPSPTQPQPFNGINAATGDYGLTLSADQLVQRVFGDASDAALGERRDQHTDAVRSVRQGSKFVDQAGRNVEASSYKVTARSRYLADRDWPRIGQSRIGPSGSRGPVSDPAM